MYEGKIPQGVRALSGQYFIPRSNELLERWMDRRFFRIPGELRWVDKYDEDYCWLRLSPTFRGKNVLLAGRGKSVCLPDGFEGPVVAINSAANYFMDKGHADTYFFSNDATLSDYPMTMIITSKNAPVPERTCYLFNPVEVGCHYNTPSAVVAIKMLLQIGVSSITLTGFDILKGGAEYFDSKLISTKKKLSEQIAPLTSLLQDPRVTVLSTRPASKSIRTKDRTPVAGAQGKLKSSSKSASSSGIST